MRTILATAVAVLLLTGCASAGNMVLKDETKASVGTKVVEGKTTRDQVVAAYGQPNATTFTDGGNEIWTYRYAHATADGVSYIPIVGLFAGGADVKSKELVIMFDKNNVVSKVSMRESQQKVRRGDATPQPAQ